ncbi:Hypothetical predicted protein [Octopus vulgaris]|uniref:DUF4371 domain-containing protein n=1 Tax=Octopus vulgaris TaxID=6645 RepID=A0AA36ASS3_OCTVU|nr:Hypothetical predicted protein [Octopus vulgaris]
MLGTKNKANECSYTITQCIAEKGKPFTDGEFIKKAFLRSAKILFSDLPNTETILSQFQEIPASVRSIERCITDVTENITIKQKVGLQKTAAFSVAVDENTDTNDMVCLAIVVRYCDNDRIYEELSCLIPHTNTGQDILIAFVNYFENQVININKIFYFTTDGAHAMVGREKDFLSF